VVSVTSAQRTRPWPRRRVFRVDARNRVALLLLARWLEPGADVTHVFGAMDNWHLLRRLGRRPLLFTVTIPGVPPAPELYRKVGRFAAETDDLAARLAACGADPERVTVVSPGVDLGRFAPAPLPPATPFRLLFASSPPRPEDLSERGVPLLIELARLRPDVEITLLWRPWGALARSLEAVAALSPPANVRVEVGWCRDLPARYSAAHAVACCFAEGRVKSAPNSVIEGLACGRPALMTSGCGLAAPISERGAGIVAAPRAADLAAAVDLLASRLPAMGVAARRLAEETFGQGRFLAAYAALYEELAMRPP
jgi:glycosyltransferase involved in cell wall biosynthesis